MKHDLTGKTAVITGATSGLGLATAFELSAMGAFVIGVGRSSPKCMQAEKMVRSRGNGEKARNSIVLMADLSSQKEINALVPEIKSRIEQEGFNCLDILINNAGTVSSWYVNTCEGIELQWAVNHLAPFLLTRRLLPLLEAAPAGRILTISSDSHYRTSINWKDVQLSRHYGCLKAYKQTKLANVLFTAELNRRLAAESRVHAFAIDPGLINTEIGLKGTSGLVRFFWKKRRLGGVPPEKAAQHVAFMASEPSIQNSPQIYWKESRPLEPSRYSKRTDAAQKLWELSEKMCGISD